MMTILKKEPILKGDLKDESDKSTQKDVKNNVFAGREEKFVNFASAVRANLEAFVC